MVGRILLDNDYFYVTSGLLGGIKITLKSRNLTLKVNRDERAKLLDVLDELKRRGHSIEPHSKEFENVLNTFSEAVWGKGDARWQAYFLEMTCEDIVIDAVGGSDRSDSSDLLEEHQNAAIDSLRNKWINFNQELPFKEDVSLAKIMECFVTPAREYVVSAYPEFSDAPNQLIWIMVFSAVLESKTHSKEIVNAAVSEIEEKYAGE